MWRNLSTYDRATLALELEPLYVTEAKRRMSEGGEKHTGSQHSGVKIEGNQISDTLPIRTDEQLAKLAGTSRGATRPHCAGA